MRSLLGFPINKILRKIKNKKMHDCIITSSRIPNIYILYTQTPCYYGMRFICLKKINV